MYSNSDHSFCVYLLFSGFIPPTDLDNGREAGRESSYVLLAMVSISTCSMTSILVYYITILGFIISEK